MNKEFRKIRFDSFMEREKIVSEYLKSNPKKVIFDFDMVDPNDFIDDMKEAGKNYEILYIPTYLTTAIPVTLAFNSKTELLMFCIEEGFEEYIEQNILVPSYNFIEYGDLTNANDKTNSEFREYTIFKYQKENPDKILFETDVCDLECFIKDLKQLKITPEVVFFLESYQDLVLLSFETRENLLEFLKVFKYEDDYEYLVKNPSVLPIDGFLDMNLGSKA